MRISHEAIYQALYVQGRGARVDGMPVNRPGVVGAAGAHAWTGQVVHHPGDPHQPTSNGGVGPRGAGALGGDLAIALNRSAIGTLVERTTRLTMLLHLPLCSQLALAEMAIKIAALPWFVIHRPSVLKSDTSGRSRRMTSPAGPWPVEAESLTDLLLTVRIAP
jgi:IS30 family transposase